jgi:hypothetical protein
MFPLKDFVSTVVKITGTSNTLAAFSKQHLALMVDQRHDAIVRSQESLLAQFWTISV